jgi:hypothetical protein
MDDPLFPDPTSEFGVGLCPPLVVRHSPESPRGVAAAHFADRFSPPRSPPPIRAFRFLPPTPPPESTSIFPSFPKHLIIHPRAAAERTLPSKEEIARMARVLRMRPPPSLGLMSKSD